MRRLRSLGRAYIGPVSAALAFTLILSCYGAPEPGGSPPPTGDASAEPEAASASTADDIGTVTIRRLNRFEFDNTTRDLLGVTTELSATFPPDTGAEGFTNNGDALTMSPLLFEKYEGAAADLAVKAMAKTEIVTCRSAEEGTRACATEILGRLARRAWRTQVAPEDVARLVALVDDAQAEGLTFRAGLQLAIQATLLSPRFLFRVERDPDPGSTAPHVVNDFELASRLSYFLWSSMPDDALFAYAEAGTLSTPRVFDWQVERMLRDPKAQALIEAFVSDWLLHNVENATPDPTLFPNFDEALRASMKAETKAFLGAFVFGDASLADMFDAKFTFLDGRLAAHYGIADVKGDTLVRVPLDPASHRGGLLTHASILTMTSVATRTSPVRRGEWVLSELLCSPPPPPPADVPSLPEQATVGTIRQRMEEHRKNPVCANCHALMDPVGFAFEHYDAVGRWRDDDHGMPIDATGQLSTGAVVDGAAELARVVKSDPRFAACTTRKLFAYALGRAPKPYDAALLASLSRSFITFGYEHTVTEQTHPWLGVTDGYHIGVTHNQPGAPYIAVNTWIVSQLAYLLDALRATPDVDGTTLLDNSIVYFASEMGEGSSHSKQDLPIIVCGGGGGRIVKGRLLDRPGQGNGNVLIALMQAMGVQTASFGNGFTTPLPGLVRL